MTWAIIAFLYVSGALLALFTTGEVQLAGNRAYRVLLWPIAVWHAFTSALVDILRGRK